MLRRLVALLTLSGIAALYAAPGLGQDRVPAATPIAIPDQIAEAHATLAAAEAAHPGNTPEVARAIETLVQRQRVARRITPETRQLAERNLNVAEAAQGKESILYARALASKAKLYLAEDRAETGRPLAEQALEIARRTAPGTLDLAEVVDALDKICWQLGDWPCALRASEEAIAAVRVAPGDQSLYLASMLQDVVRIRMSVKDEAGARAAMDESMELVERQSKPAPAMAIIESNAGEFLVFLRKYDEALIHLDKARALSEAIYGADSIQAGYATVALGGVYSMRGQAAQAEVQFARAIELYRRWYGRNHTTTAELENSYALTVSQVGRQKDALDLALEAHKLNREYFSLAVRVLPERQALALVGKSADSLNLALSILTRHPELDETAAYQEEIRSRGLATEEMAQRQASLNRENDPEVARLLKELDQERLAALTSSGSRAASGKQEEAYTDATVRMEKTERALAERSLTFRSAQRTETVTLADVRRNLPADAVLVSYVRFDRWAPEHPEERTIPAYMAFVLHPGTEKIRVFDLGEGRGIDALVKQLRDSADDEAHSGGMGAVRNERIYRAAGEALRARVWDPLRASLGTARLALVVADGNLSLIPFAGLPDGKGYLVEHGPVIHMLTSERDLVPSDETRHNKGLLAIGSPRFSRDENPARRARLRDAPADCESFQRMEFRPLPGSAEELNDIGSAWQRWNRQEDSSFISGPDATRERFLREASRRRILHVATHAFQLDARCGDGNPLLRSGLVFAGINDPGREAAILTAQQIASLDLNGVEWAVLSACNTGNGELKDGEGVLGLERAFRVAGAHTVIMTLWPVDDLITRAFMRTLYTERLSRKADTAEAVREASRKLLADRRAAGRSTHPWYWAGFVGAGDWR